MKAKEILKRYSSDLKRVAMLEYDLKCIDSTIPIKVTDYSAEGGGHGGGVEDTIIVQKGADTVVASRTLTGNASSRRK